jgi:hypothetical protein
MKLLTFLMMLIPFTSFSKAPTNDEPCGAIDVPVGTGAGFCSNVNFSMTGATNNAAYVDVCNGENGTNPDVWFKCTVPNSGKINIYTSFQQNSTSEDAVMYIYSATDCASPLTYINCNDDGNVQPYDYMPVIKAIGLSPGNQIFIRFVQYDGGVDGTFNICVTDPEPALVLDKKVGIGISSPDSTLDLNGNLIVRGGARIGSDFKVQGNVNLSSGNPGIGKVLTSDADGNASWQSSIGGNLNSGFSATLNTVTVPSGEITKINLLGTFDDGSNFNPGTSEYTAPSSGLYRFDAQFQWLAATFSGNKPLQIEILKNGTEVNRSIDLIPSSSLAFTQHTGFTLKLVAGDKITIWVYQNTGTTVDISTNYSFFSGYKIY